MKERQTLLIVDDQELNRVILREALSQTYHIIEAADGNEALQMMEAHYTQIAGVLLDVVMPEVDGFEVLRTMKERNWLRTIPVFLITAETDSQVLVQGFELGVMDVITKPFCPELVKKRVDNMVELYRRRFELEALVLEQTARLRQPRKKWTPPPAAPQPASVPVQPPEPEPPDPSETDEARFLLELQKEKYQVISEFSEDMIFSYNAISDSMELSEKFCRVFQVPAYLRDYSTHPEPSFLFLPEEYQGLVDRFHRLSWADQQLEMDLHLKLPDGTMPWFHLALRTLWSSRDRSRELGYVGKLTNINRIKREATKWQQRANTDPLTQLHNRAGAHLLFEQMLRECAEQDRKMTVVFMDIDHFKSLNDTLGHAAGDQILIAFSQNVRRQFRPTDIVARFGGDEFLVIMKDTGDEAFARRKLEPLCHQTLFLPALKLPAGMSGEASDQLPVSSSIGVAFYPDDAQDFDALLRKADSALYASKRAGRGTVSFCAAVEAQEGI